MPTTPPALPTRPAGPRFARDLAQHGSRVALLTADEQLSYAQLAERVQDVARALGPVRRLVLLEARSTVEAVVGYLACLSAGCPVLLAPPSALSSLSVAYDPDVLLLEENRWQVRERRPGTTHVLHEDLALLLSTSGSTGSPKLVRLSHDNLAANAAAIAATLALRSSDVAATTLPLAYSYGLSVLNSHLERGAGVLLTDLSVVDPCFWELFRRQRATSLAGVPHTFDLLDRVGFPEMQLPTLRRVTQAGGRMAPEQVRRYAELGQHRGWDLHVMYGQTEATARMACLPPDLARDHPASIGRPVPGGAFTIDAVDGEGVGELVYEGPNVMLGYASSPRDLALGRTTDRLRTGDLARLNPAGLYEVVGRRSRISKVFGLRIDLPRVEEQLAQHGVEACCVASDDELVVVAAAAPEAVAERAAELAGLPRRAVRVVGVDALPRLHNGKPDLQQVTALGARPPVAAPPARPTGDLDGLCALFAEVLDRPATADDSFIGLGGDSLSYVELSLRLEEALGTLPAGWHTMPLRDLAPARQAPRRGRVVETGLLLRGVAILLIVGSHSDLWTLVGGAHVLLAVAGFNVARFHLTHQGASPARRALRSAWRIAVPVVPCIALAAALTERYTMTNVLLLNGILGPDRWTAAWHFWFVEVLVYLLLVTAALLCVPAVRRAEQRWPWGFSLALLGAGVLSRFQPQWLDLGPDRIHTAHVVFWLFALGWAGARATRTRHRVLLTAVLLATVPGFFGDGRREALVMLGIAALLWLRTVRLPRQVAAAAQLLAEASLHIYVTHWLVYPYLEPWSPLAATLASVAVGVAYRAVDVRTQAAVRRAWAARRRRTPAPLPPALTRRGCPGAPGAR